MIQNKINNIFDFISEANITEEWVYEHKGEYPVYSGQTENDGIFDYIDEYCQDKPCITFTTYGSAGKLFYREGKYTIGRNCMGLVLKDEYEDKVNLKWFSYYFQSLFYSLTIGDPKGQKSLNKKLLKNVEVSIPDIDTQERQLALYEEAQTALDNIKRLEVRLQNLLNSELE